MNVLVACEFSGVVRDAFAARGHRAVDVRRSGAEANAFVVRGVAISDGDARPRESGELG